MTSTEEAAQAAYDKETTTMVKTKKPEISDSPTGAVEMSGNSKKIQKGPKSSIDCSTTVFTEFQQQQ